MYRKEDDQHQSSSSSCSSSSIDGNTNNAHVNQCSSKDLSTDLRLGLSISSHDSSFSPRGQYSDWPPIKTLLRSTLAAGKSNCRQQTLFVKVYMEGIPIGRKLDLLAHRGYHSLITTLVQMFRTNILFPSIICHDLSVNCHILTYEDKEGDWMMVGDVPWEIFLTTVKRLKIAALEKC
ncbi:hypothetical protein BVRB_3g070500 [Beta vulgaris subsp. vulgaris]|uniref:Auxin-responsive protein n=1 Tax=Beta vulgaris subsp. vulgaris TaxID=3555 RepID=A0A0J8BF41_BETVV|nr:hypothetical protein BVRB_3g070500 [Beta vulgaris subsp. vulgaris]